MPAIERTQSGDCGTAAVDETKKIWIGGQNVGVSGWTAVVEEVKALKLKDEERIADELLKRVMKTDFVPSSKKQEYKTALLEEYRKGH